MMNDPYVHALHYWVTHDDSVNYANTPALKYEDERFQVVIKDRQFTIRPKDHYASEEEAKAAVEGFICHWEFQAALESGSNTFSLTYLRSDVRDRNPTPPPPGVIQLRAKPLTVNATISAPRLRVGRVSYPSPPSGPTLNTNTLAVQAMLYQLDKYHQRRITLAPMAYFCLTTLEDSAPKTADRTNKDKATGDHYAISRKVLVQVRRLSSTKGGVEARKGDGVSDDFTDEERKFLLVAVQEFIRRAAEKDTNPGITLPKITMADLPKS